MGLKEYRRKRDFHRTAEPAGEAERHAAHRREPRSLVYMIQKHAATRLHYDFRLELDGVLLSWAVPKGPSLDPAEKHLAVHVEDHPIEYATFEGTIPKGQYGGGTVLLWDRGTWEPQDDPREGMRRGRLKIELHGEKLRGGWVLVRMAERGGAPGGRRGGSDEDGKENWLLFKEKDDEARTGRAAQVTELFPKSVATGRTLEEIARDADAVWHSNRAEKSAAKTRAAKTAPGRTTSPARADRPPARAARSESTPAVADLDALEGARKGPLPRTLAPELATLVSAIPQGDEWVHEIKLDGYRALAFLEDGAVRFESRNGKDWTARFAPLAAAIERLPARSALLDGEVVVLRPDGTTSFNDLQKALGDGGDGDDLVYYAFDLLHLDGRDLRAVPLVERKRVLESLLAANEDPRLRLSAHVAARGPEFYREACKHALEGVVSKRSTSRYVSGRTREWVKTKCLASQELVIGGYTGPSKGGSPIAALLLGAFDRKGAGKKLVYAGKVGTGLSAATARDLAARLERIPRDSSPFDPPPPRSVARAARWVKPELVAAVEFTEWTPDGVLRHPSFEGLREDKSPAEVLREQPAAPPGEPPPAGPPRAASPRAASRGRTKPPARSASPAAGPAAGAPTSSAHASRSSRGAPPAEVAGVRISSPDRVVFAADGHAAVTKLDVARYYEAVAPYVLPHVSDRPLAIVRCPEGQSKPCFFQKHLPEHTVKGLHGVEVPEKDGTGIHLYVDSLEGLIGLVQMGALEIHPWGSRVRDIERPDLLTFDLDPDETLPWERVAEAALLVRARLEGIGLESWLKTTGGKGLHVVVPIRSHPSWDEAKELARLVVESIERERPKEFTTNMAKARRPGRVFLDYLRNGRGATAVAAYSTRARPGAPVATPIEWRELAKDVRGDAFHVGNVPERLARRKDPWADFGKARQAITKTMLKALRAG